MIDHGKVESNVRPEVLAVDEFSVWHADNIQEVERDNEESKEIIYTFDLKQYTKDEYILQTIEANKTSSDLAIAELAETVLGVLG